MKAVKISWTIAIVLGALTTTFVSCDNSNDPMSRGQAEFMITDAPSDDASIKSVFVTVVDLKVDGHSISGFTKQTIDLKAYQEGSAKLLGTAQLDAKTYSSVTLVLDTDSDANGNMPGCYVLTADNSKYKLKDRGTVEVTVSKDWNVTASSKSTIVLDFDLRKSVQAMSDQSVRYNFVSNANLQSAIRLVVQSQVGSINGSYTEQAFSGADKVLVYAYKRGSYNASTETQAQGSGVLFANAVSGAEIKQGLTARTFKLAFLEEGEYELHFAAYDKSVSEDRFVFRGMLKSQTTSNGSSGEFIAVQSGITISISTAITGLM